MFIDVIDWDDADDPGGNVQHIAEHDVTVDEVEEILSDHQGMPDESESSGKKIVFGWTSTGKHLAVVFSVEDDPELIIVRPVTAYPVPEYGD
jgi:uncharacterized DUF497 family protein